MKVLVAVDGSPGSFDAICQIGQLLTAGKDEVGLYCSPPEFRLQSAPISTDVLSRARQVLADSIFAEARKRLPEALQASVHAIVGSQDPRHGILLAAEQWSAQLIVVGARGLGTLERLLLGSVSRAVVHGAKIPVWVARPKPAKARPGFRILLACESAELGRHSADLLTRFTWPADADCQILTVISSLFSGRVPQWLQQQARSPEVEEMVQAWAREHDEEMRANLNKIQALIETLPAPLSAAKPLIAEGEPASEILAAIAQQQSNLVVIGVKRKWTLSSAILGSTSEAVLNHAECSVLLVPHQEAP